MSYRKLRQMAILRYNSAGKPARKIAMEASRLSDEQITGCNTLAVFTKVSQWDTYGILAHYAKNCYQW
jgi:hypothetical protein